MAERRRCRLCEARLKRSEVFTCDGPHRGEEIKKPAWRCREKNPKRTDAERSRAAWLKRNRRAEQKPRREGLGRAKLMLGRAAYGEYLVDAILRAT